MKLLKYHFLMCTFLVATQSCKDMDFCYDSSRTDFRLNATVIKVTGVSQCISCVMDCVLEPCCRSINYNKDLHALQNETNCEMLHDVVSSTSEEFLQKNASYHYVQLTDPQKEYNHRCLSKHLDEYITGSEILSSEPLEFSSKVEEWLPKTGNWRACWRATRDGWDVTREFHELCDGKIPTLTIVKVVQHGKNYIFGGYANESWAGEGPTSAPGSFLFSLRNKENLSPFKSPLKDKNDKKAIYRHSSNGPTFGESYDLYIANIADKYKQSSTNFGHAYQVPLGYTFAYDKTKSLLAGSEKFTPSEVEVLYLPD